MLLQAGRRARRRCAALLARNDVALTDCVVQITPERRVPGEGHPDASVHAEWARCVAEQVLAPAS